LTPPQVGGKTGTLMPQIEQIYGHLHHLRYVRPVKGF
jgi:hypothetical protein